MTLIRLRHVAISAAIGLALVIASCNKSPTRPSTTETGSTPLPGATVRVELVVPASIAPGESVQLTLNAIKLDGSVENVSSQAQWTPADSSILQLTSTGLATGKDRGEQVVLARFSGRSATARILVLPKGTFRLAGTVQDSGFGLENVTLTVISGVGEGLTTRSAADGAYAFYGVSGPVRIQLKKDGYLNDVEQFDVSANRTQDFVLVPERPRKDYGGTYTLTVSAGEPCRSLNVLPEEGKRRVYTANVTEDGGRLTVTLTGADFIVTNGYGNWFLGFVDASDGLTFPIGVTFDFYYYYYNGHLDIVERFRSTALSISGNVTARGTPSRIAGTMNGWILITKSPTPPFQGGFSSRCYSAAHDFEMVRR
jgi:hypothetical protein